MKFTKENCQMLGTEIEQALQQVAMEHNVVIKRGNGRFTPNNFTLKLEISAIDETGVTQTRERSDWETSAFLYGLDKDWLDKEFIFNGERYKVAGIKPKSRKYPVLAQHQITGKHYKFTPDLIKTLMRE